MKFYVIHDPRFPLRKIFLQAQFKRYNITKYEFVEIPQSGVILSTYIDLLYNISVTKNIIQDNTFCILIDTVLLTRNFLDRVKYGHFKTIVPNNSYDIIFIHPSSIHSTKIIKKKMIIHKDIWKWSDQNNYSSCFIITPTCAKLFHEYHTYCQETNEYKNNKTGMTDHSLFSVDKWLFNCALMYSNYPLKTLWLS
jgi:hypothetical protein